MKIPVLTYHDILKDDMDSDNKWFIYNKSFETQMKFLYDKGYKSLTSFAFA